MSTVLVTGVSGFIAAHCIVAALNAGHTRWGGDDLSDLHRAGQFARTN